MVNRVVFLEGADKKDLTAIREEFVKIRDERKIALLNAELRIDGEVAEGYDCLRFLTPEELDFEEDEVIDFKEHLNEEEYAEFLKVMEIEENKAFLDGVAFVYNQGITEDIELIEEAIKNIKGEI